MPDHAQPHDAAAAQGVLAEAVQQARNGAAARDDPRRAGLLSAEPWPAWPGRYEPRLADGVQLAVSDLAGRASAHLADRQDRLVAAAQWTADHPLDQFDAASRVLTTEAAGVDHATGVYLADALDRVRAALARVGDRAMADYLGRVGAAGSQAELRAVERYVSHDDTHALAAQAAVEQHLGHASAQAARPGANTDRIQFILAAVLGAGAGPGGGAVAAAVAAGARRRARDAIAARGGNGLASVVDQRRARILLLSNAPATPRARTDAACGLPAWTDRLDAAAARRARSAVPDLAGLAAGHLPDPTETRLAAAQWRADHPLAQFDVTAADGLAGIGEARPRRHVCGALAGLRAELVGIITRARADYTGRVAAAATADAVGEVLRYVSTESSYLALAIDAVQRHTTAAVAQAGRLGTVDTGVVRAVFDDAAGIACDATPVRPVPHYATAELVHAAARAAAVDAVTRPDASRLPVVAVQRLARTLLRRAPEPACSAASVRHHGGHTARADGPTGAERSRLWTS